MSELLLSMIPYIWGAYLIILSLWIVLQKRSPQSTMGWLLALAWLPIVGWFIYYLVGPQKLKRHTLVRAQDKETLTSNRSYFKEQLTKALQFYPNVKFDENGLPTVDDENYQNISKNFERLKLPELISLEAHQISHMIYKSTGLPMSVASNYELLVGGEKTYTAIFEAIQQAKHTIHLEYYIFKPDETGNAFRDLLTQKAREGVKVRLLLDWLGSRKITHHYMADFLAAGGELDFFHKGGLLRIQSLLNMRLHRKILVCDGRIGFTGGVNISNQQDERRTKHANHDLHFKVTGPVAYWLDEVFLEDWYYTTKKIPQDLPPPMLFEDIAFEDIKQMQVIAAGPDTPDAPLWRAKLAAIDAAKQKVWLVTPYFVPDEPAVCALTTAALKGLDVRIMLPERSNHLTTDLAGRSWFKELMTAGVKIWAYNPERMIHAKFLVVDDCYSFIGTDNFDNRSFRLNFEAAILSYEHSTALALTELFEHDMNNAKLLKMSDLKNTWWQCLPESVARLASPLL